MLVVSVEITNTCILKTIKLELVDEVDGNDVDCKINNSATFVGALFTLHASQIHVDLPTITEKGKQVRHSIYLKSFML